MAIARILIVEDETTLSEAYQTLLESSDYETRVALDGGEALQLLDTFRPNLIMLDLRMPNMDGITFLKKADLKRNHPDVKTIIFSNYDMQSEIDEAYKLGADRYILKAWASPRELLQIVENTLAG